MMIASLWLLAFGAPLTNEVRLSASYGQPGSDLSNFGDQMVAGMGYAWQVGNQSYVPLELEATVDSGSYPDYEFWALNVGYEFVANPWFYFFVGAGYGHIELGRRDEDGINHFAGLGLRFGDHVRLFGRGDYFVAGSSNDGSIEFNNLNLNVSLVRIGLTFAF